MGSCAADVGTYNLSGFCDPEMDKRIAAAFDQQVAEPGKANDAWAAIDRAVVDAAAMIPYGNRFRRDFVSRRVGNVLVHPGTGPLITQMWVQ